MSTNNGTSSGLDRLDPEGVETMSDVSVTFEPEKVSVEALAHLGEGPVSYTHLTLPTIYSV